MIRGIGMVSRRPCLAVAGVKSGRLPETVGVPAVQIDALAVGAAAGGAADAAVDAAVDAAGDAAAAWSCCIS
jgi:hypothetical protein